MGFGYRLFDFVPPMMKTQVSLHVNVARVQVLGGQDVSGDLFRRGVSLPCATELTEADQERVVAAVRSFFG